MRIRISKKTSPKCIFGDDEKNKLQFAVDHEKTSLYAICDSFNSDIFRVWVQIKVNVLGDIF